MGNKAVKGGPPIHPKEDSFYEYKRDTEVYKKALEDYINDTPVITSELLKKGKNRVVVFVKGERVSGQMGASDYRIPDEYVIHTVDIPDHPIGKERIKTEEENKKIYEEYRNTGKKTVQMYDKIAHIIEDIKKLNAQIETTKKNIEYCQQNSGTDPGKVEKLQANILDLEKTLKEDKEVYNVLKKTSDEAYEKYLENQRNPGKTNGGRRRAKTHRHRTRKSTSGKVSKRLRRKTGRKSRK